ncbi:hypothetical protein BV25DRAFT_1907836 [Artomyces pyxidatus]|uniref:Uncharacterized protein n=1 Tax=Artomyces pyxidatus TaxID=48021 RepID=A0ACB8T1A0_9AGAM|nr:hypothetical protein BV25DRAFT_1907836 [Artomyces pyxidatus]
MSSVRYKLVFFCPTPSTAQVLNHLFSQFPEELGKIGNYRQCAFISRGTGQFLPEGGSNPAVGSVGTLEYVEEDRVELVVNDSGGDHAELRNAIDELKKVHPYEQVAYDVYRLENF